MATVTRKRQLTRQVAIVGAGLSQFGAFPDKDSRDLFVEAFQDMMETMDKPFDIDDIECAYIGNYSSDLFETQGHTAPIVADWLGMTPIPITRIENACASSGSALREGVMAIASGMYDIVLVGGMEKMTNLPTEGVTDVLASAADGLYEVPAGLTFPGIFGAIAKAHMDRYETNLDHLLKVGIKNHENGALNPKAQFNVTIHDLMERRKARAEQRGQPVPEYRDEMDFLNDQVGQPLDCVASAAFMTAPPSPTAPLASCWSLPKSPTTSPTALSRWPGSGRRRANHCTTPTNSPPCRRPRRRARQAYEMAGITVRRRGRGRGPRLLHHRGDRGQRGPGVLRSWRGTAGRG